MTFFFFTQKGLTLHIVVFLKGVSQMLADAVIFPLVAIVAAVKEKSNISEPFFLCYLEGMVLKRQMRRKS